MALFDFGFSAGTEKKSGSSATTQSGTQTQQKQLSQEAINKLIYDALSQDAGLASLATGENLSGGYAATTKAQQAQDFMVKIIGELANVTAANVTTQSGTSTTKSSESTSKKSGGLKTVICTHLHSIGLLSSFLYNHPKAIAHLSTVHPYTLAGYHLWAVPFVSFLKKHPFLAKLLAPICRSRYEQVVFGYRTFGGFLTITIGHPICYLIGAAANIGARYGHVAS